MNALAFPYTWSNPDADSQVLLANALLRPRFTDLVTLMREYGEDSLLSTLEELKTEGDIPVAVASEVRGMLNNIAKGFHEYRSRAHQAA